MMTEVQLEENNVSLSPYCKYLLEKQERNEPVTCWFTMEIHNIAIWKYNPVHKNFYLNKYQHVEGYTKTGVTLSCVFSSSFILNICSCTLTVHLIKWGCRISNGHRCVSYLCTRKTTAPTRQSCGKADCFSPSGNSLHYDSYEAYRVYQQWDAFTQKQPVHKVPCSETQLEDFFIRTKAGFQKYLLIMSVMLNAWTSWKVIILFVASVFYLGCSYFQMNPFRVIFSGPL